VSDVEALRAQLRDRGYLTHGIERWFALDPWSSRTFWVELALVALKAATLIAAFAAVLLTAIMLIRNQPLGALETLTLFGLYAAASLVAAFALVVAIALALKLRPALPIDTPYALLAISLAAAALLTAPLALWWFRFDTPPDPLELAVGGALGVLFFLVATVVVSAALLSFSIYEVGRVPAIHQKPRGVPMAIAAALLIALLFVPGYAGRDREAAAPMVVTSPSSRHLVLIGVDGLTYPILRSRFDLVRRLPVIQRVATIPARSTTERWASLATGVPTARHGVRAIEGLRLTGSSHVLQRISRADAVLLHAAPLVRLARREPLPPTVRRRDYLWEIFAGRGVPSVAVNWWATADETSGALRVVGPASIFSQAGGVPLRLDAIATQRFTEELEKSRPRFAALYLPSLDVIINRVDLDPSARLTGSMQALEGISRAVSFALDHNYDVLLVGLPGDGQSGAGVIASTIPIEGATSAWDAAPTVTTALGFPASNEMPGSARLAQPSPRITSYGPRSIDETAQSVDQEYYDNLRSLGYIR
jgi:hypothetical protein